MSIPADMPKRMLETQGELQAVKARMAALQQSKQLLIVTQAHLNEKEDVQRLWQGVGKMFLAVSKDEYTADAAKQIKNYDEQLSALQKKEQYFATTLDKMVLAVTPKE